MVNRKEYNDAHREEINATARAYYESHRDKINEQRRERAKKNPDLNKIRCREYRKEHLEERRLAESEYHKAHREEKSQYDSEYRKANKERIVAYQESRRLRLWNEALTFFGPCACCGESRIPFLTIDHKNGGGNQSRAKGEKYGWGLLSSWSTARWPEELKKTYRILCHNCNQATRYGNACPHQVERDEAAKTEHKAT